MKAAHTIRPVFDDPNQVAKRAATGLVPALRLAESAGLHDLLGQHLSVDSPNPVAKTTTVIGGMLAGSDRIDDLDLLRHGGLFGGVRSPSTLGTFLRSFTHGHVQQLDAVGSRVLSGLAAWAPGLVTGGEHKDGGSLISITRSVRSTAMPNRPPPTATPEPVA